MEATLETTELVPDRLRRYARVIDWIDESFNDYFKSPAAIVLALETMESMSDLDPILIDECAYTYRNYSSAVEADSDIDNGREMWLVGKAIKRFLKPEFYQC